MSNFNLAKTVRLQSKSDLLNWLRQNVQNGVISKEDLQSVVAEEGFLTKLKHTFTKDAKCAASINKLLTVIKSLDDEKFKAVKIDNFFMEMKLAEELMKFIEVCAKATDPIMKWWEKNKNAPTQVHEIELENIITTSGKLIKSKFDLRRVENLIYTYKPDSAHTTADVGYNKTNTYNLLARFTHVIAGNRKITTLLNGINNALEFFEAVDFKDPNRKTYFDAIIWMRKAYDRIDYIGFYLSKQLV